MASDLDLKGRFMQHAEYDLLRIYLLGNWVNKGKAGRAGAIRPWPSKCCQSGSDFAS